MYWPSTFLMPMVPDTSMQEVHPLFMFVIPIVFVFVLLHMLLVFTIGIILDPGISAVDMKLVESCFVFRSLLSRKPNDEEDTMVDRHDSRVGCSRLTSTQFGRRDKGCLGGRDLRRTVSLYHRLQE